jgi:hypothetical protein
MSNGRIFFAGVAATVLLLGAGFGGGLMLARTAMEPVPQNRVAASDHLPPARVILPPSAQAAPAPTIEAAVPPPAPSPQLEARAQVVPAKDVEVQSQPADKDKQADRAEQRKAEVAERERRRRYAERNARREAARARQEQPPGMMTFSASEQQPSSRGFFGN